MSNKNELLQLMGIGDNDYIVFNQIINIITNLKLYSVNKLDYTACELFLLKEFTDSSSW